MDMNEDKELDLFIKKMVQEAGLESPSEHFTSGVLKKVQHMNLQSPATIYQPLISKKTWALLGLVLSGIILYVVVGNGKNDSSWLANVNFDFLSKYDAFTVLSNSFISEILDYSIVGLILFVYIQIFLLKRYMDKRISLG